MNHQKSQDKAHSKNKLNQVWLVVLVVMLLLVSVFVYLLFFKDSNFLGLNGDADTSSERTFGGGKGGDANLAQSYDNQAVAAWKSGDKAKAKDLANKGMQEASKLSTEQLKQLPDAIGLTYRLQTMSDGEAP